MYVSNNCLDQFNVSFDLTAIYHALRYFGLGDSAHDLVADTTPPSAQLGDEAVTGKVVDQHSATLRQDPEISQGDRAEHSNIDEMHTFDGAPLKSDRTMSWAIFFCAKVAADIAASGLRKLQNLSDPPGPILWSCC